ncbi:hypothetical protein BE20_57775 [Sorangium cellulosum]|uniref:Uncharacterized protein n=1 Tax=Sorangium cellulosum TaxID=56 RepID=A0A150T549_SORCE|nr:hypothetical protein BE20_57775 [Sorangium cellulosum]KYF99965.1 hypothetical protein BE18_09615 [Sorangium cellulosum]
MTHEAPEHDDLDRTGDVDPLVEACVADALSPYLGALSPEEIEDYRRLLEVFITTHPASMPLYDRLRARPPVLSESGEVAREGAGAGGAMATPAAPERGDGTFGGRR